MAGYIEDRWLKKRPDKKTGKRERTALYGKGLRYKVAGIPGVRSRSFKNVDDAKAWKAKAEHESSTGEFVDARRGDMLLKDYIEKHWWPGRTDEPSTAGPMKSRIWRHIIPLLGSKRLRDIDAAALRTFKAELLTRVDGSASVIWTHLSTILESAVDDQRIVRNPCRTARTVKAPRPQKGRAKAWTRETADAVRENLQPRYKLALDLAVGAGLRQGEAFGLGLDDIDFDTGYLHVRRQLRWDVKGRPYFRLPKGDKTREVPLPPRLLARIKSAVEEFPPVDCTLPWRNPEPPTTDLEAKQRRPITVPLLLTTSQGNRIAYKTWNERTWKKALAAAGVIEVIGEKLDKPRGGRQRKRDVYELSREDMFHVGRHTFASVQLQAGESVVTLSKWLGHASPNITLEHYAHFMPEAGARGLQVMDGWFEDRSLPILPENSLTVFDLGRFLKKSQVNGVYSPASGLKVKYKETARGGLAVNIIEC
ncbi:tyrosine-type recombinase/integrase [Streptomyces sp. NPDC001268]|uniref:tyrosine-type recombinase/integrase n=1 Tax=Streptomyces sp. NPDC001268 TaxID=3364553 RepID=UPI0036B2F5F9